MSVERDSTQFHRGSANSGPASSSELSSSLSSVHLADTAGDVGGLAGSGQSLGRGATRGRRDRVEQSILRTKPTTVSSKRGSGGTDITLSSNYFELIAKPNWRLMQYR